jgi:glycosyltransferase involved in cell wall biosynthesis/2-polyprenyl-3-methyl-5-hydroxy-6-metoxy-1,4-benzoquinol methylase
MKLAYFSPLNPQACGISDYSEELLPYLATHAEIDLFVDGFAPSNHDLPVTNCFDYKTNPSALDQLENYDAIFYHVGNDYRFHYGTCTVLRRHPGIVVFHDYVLEDTFLGRAREIDDFELYLDEMEACHGPSERGRAEEFIRRGLAPPQEDTPLDYPLNLRTARSAEGIIAHSEWSRSRLAQLAPGTPTARIAMPVRALNPGLRRAWMQRNPLRQFISIASFGLITPDKGIDATLQGLASLKGEFDFHYTLVGAENNFYDVRESIIRHGLSEHVTITGYVSLEDFERHIAETDIAINLRDHTVGETSASLCRLMGIGIPAIVSDIGWFAEIPDDCVVKISPADNFAALQSKLRTLIEDANLRKSIGDRARDHVLTEHNAWRTAEAYIAFAREVIEQRPARHGRSFSDVNVRIDGRAAPDATHTEGPTSIASTNENSRVQSRRLKIAYFSPLNPQPSGISDYSEELLMHLRRLLDVDLFVDGFEPTNAEMAANFAVIDYQKDPSALDKLEAYDAVLYHLGNDYRYHGGIYWAMQKHPGVVVLHDFALQDFFLGIARQQRRMSIYFDELEACHGKRERHCAEEQMSRGAVPPHEGAPLDFPLNARIARSSEGIIVHSEWVRERIAEVSAGVPVTSIKHHITDRAAETPVPERAQNGKVTIASFGGITRDKAIERALRALSALRDEFSFEYVLVGSSANFPDLPDVIRNYGLEDRVTLTNYVGLEEFQQRILSADIAINLRERPVGATSGSLCRLMAAGVPTIVSNVGAFTELPDNAVVKIDHDQAGDALLQAYLRRLIDDPSLRARIGRNAREYVLAEHKIEMSAAKYAAFIREVIARRPRTNFVKSIGNELSALGIRSIDEKVMQSVASEIAALAPAAEFTKTRFAFPKTAQPTRKIEPVVRSNGHADSRKPPDLVKETEAGRMRKIEGVDYKRGAAEYARALSPELNYYLRTKPFTNLHKPIKFSGDGMDIETARHFYDFANIAVALALRADAKILDVGCGPGWVSEYFARIGYDMTGIDISDDLIQVARERIAALPYQVDQETPVRCRFLVHDIEAGPLAEKFDAIICYDALHHFEVEQSVFRNLAAMLEIGGVLFVVEGQKPEPDSALEIELRGFMEKYQTLESPFSEDYLRALIDQNGFKIVADYVSVNGLFEQQMLHGEKDDRRLPLRTLDTGYHYLTCMKVADGGPGSAVADSPNPSVLHAKIMLRGSLPESVVAGEELILPITLINIGDTVWLTGQTVREGLVMPGVKIIDIDGHVAAESHGPLLPRCVAPGRSLTIDLHLNAPRKAGAYSLKIDLVDQNVCWFEERGSEPVVVDLIVSEARP